MTLYLATSISMYKVSASGSRQVPFLTVSISVKLLWQPSQIIDLGIPQNF